jgi:UDP-glucose 4-epimerase
MRVLVTGGAGFIGANVCRALLASPAGHEVVVLDDLSSGFWANLEGVAVTMVEGTVLDPDVAEGAAAGADAVVHLAGRGSVPRSIADPVASWEANATGTLNVLQAARKAGGLHVVLASSSSVYGANATLPKEEHLVPLPVSPYAASKLAAEGLALAFQHSYQLPVLAFRFFNVFGPWQRPRHDYAAVVPAFVSAALTREALPVHGDGKQSRDFTYVDTLAAVVVSAVERGVVHPEPVNLAFGTRTDLLSLVGTLEDVLGSSLAVEHLPGRPGDVRHTEADSSRLLSLFPDVEPVGLEAGLRATVDWYRAYDIA